MSLNSNFPFLLTDNTTTCISTQYSLATDNISKFSDNKFPFEYLEWNIENSNRFNSANINYFDETGTMVTPYPIDIVANNSELNKISVFYNEDKNYNFTTENVFSQLLDHENLFKVIRYLKSVATYNTGFVKSCAEASTDLLKQNKFYELYNDKDGDDYYAEDIYRARIQNTCAVLNNILVDNYNKPAIIPIFSAITENSSLMAYIKIRNVSIPMKRVLAGKNDKKYNFIFIYPEYIFKKYSQYMYSIQKIQLTGEVSDNKVYYSNLKDKDVAFTYGATYQTLGETQSSSILNYTSNV